MTSFVQPEFSVNHGGIARAQAAYQYVTGLGQRLNSARGLASLLLAGGFAAFVTVADQMIDTWADGHLLVAWVVLWTVLFTSMALFANSAGSLTKRLAKALQIWSNRLAQDRADAHLLLTAQSDPRVMADLRAAISRAENMEMPLSAHEKRRIAALSAKRERAVEKARADSDRLMWAAAQHDPRLMAELQEAMRRAEAV
jgi:hypothetical protein